MKDALLQRVKEFADSQNLSINALSKRVNIKQSTISGWFNTEKTPPITFALTLLEVFPNLSAEWLLRGEGTMLKGSDAIVGSNVVTGNGNSNIHQQTNALKQGFSARLIAAIMRGCSTQEEQDRLIEELDNYSK